MLFLVRYTICFYSVAAQKGNVISFSTFTALGTFHPFVLVDSVILDRVHHLIPFCIHLLQALPNVHNNVSLFFWVHLHVPRIGLNRWSLFVSGSHICPYSFAQLSVLATGCTNLFSTVKYIFFSLLILFECLLSYLYSSSVESLCFWRVNASQVLCSCYIHEPL